MIDLQCCHWKTDSDERDEREGTNILTNLSLFGLNKVLKKLNKFDEFNIWISIMDIWMF